MKRTISLLLTVIFLAALPVAALSAPPTAQAPTLLRVDYNPLGLDTRYFLYTVIPEYVDAFTDTATGGGTVQMEIEYNEGDGVWRAHNTVDVWSSTTAAQPNITMVSSTDIAPWSEFRVRLKYSYRNGAQPATSAWSAVKRDETAPRLTPQGIVYTNALLGFSVTLPSSWAGKFLINAGFGDHVVFYNKRNQSEVYLGRLFSIAVSGGAPVEIQNPVKIATGNGKTAYYSLPTDVQYDAGNASLRDEYLKMQSDVQNVIKSFSFVAPPRYSAQPSSSAVIVNGKQIAFDAYTINESNYFKLRDLAYVLSGTEAQFDVGWDGARNAITLTRGKPYSVMGGEMAGRGTGVKNADPNASTIYIDGAETALTAYTIDGLNYFMLRDMGRAFNFSVLWDGAANAIIIDTGKGYTG